MPENNDLSEREREILRLVATGASNKEIASQLFISANTVKVHLRNIFSKIGAASRTEAAMYAASLGLVDGIAPVVDEEISEESVIVATSPEPVLPVPEIVQAQKPFPLWLILFIVVIVASAIILRETLIPDSPPASSSTAQLPIEGQESVSWQIKAPLPAPRSGIALIVAEDRIYAIGGEAAYGVVGDVTYYDAVSDAWQSGIAKPTPVKDIQAAVLGGRIYVPGGQMSNGKIYDGLEIYDPRQDSWTTGKAMPTALSAYSLVAFEGNLYLFGGWDGKQFVSSVYEYDPEQDQWSTRQELPNPMGYAGAVIANGRVFILGGFDGEQALDITLQYFPEAEEAGGETFRRLKPLPQGRYAMGVASVADIIYVVGGIGDQAELPYLEYFVPLDNWIPFNPGEEFDWSNGGMTILGTDLHLLGGVGNGERLAQHLSYRALYVINMPVVR